MARSLFVFVIALATIATCGCSTPDFRSEYAISKLDLPNGQAVFFKREVRGINGNYDVVAISANGDPCTSMNPETDYSIHDCQTVYYKLETGTLHLFYSTATGKPAKPFPVRLVNHEINNMDFDKFRNHYASEGIVRLDLPIDGTKKCG